MASGELTFLFTDLVGSTELTSRLGDDAADALRRLYFGLWRDAISATGGREVKGLGDGVMVTFESAAAAVDCAMAMQQAIARQNARPDSEKLELRVGAHVGPSIVDGDDYYGMAVTVAKRLTDRAAGGQVLLSEAVRHAAALDGEGSVRLVGDLELKGVTGTVTTHELCWQPVAAAILPLPPVLARSRPTAMVGRDDELRLLDAALEDVGGPQLLLVEGEPGMGKTRLVAEFAGRAHAKEMRVLHGACTGQNWIPYEPFVEALTWVVLACPIDELRLDVGAGARELRRVVPEVALRMPDVPSPLDGDPSGERHRIVVALARVVAAGGRTLLVLEDIQWIDDASLRVLEAALRATDPVTVVATCRSGQRPALDVSPDRIREIELGPLSHQDVASLIADRTGRQIPVEVAADIAGRAQGNPLIVEETVRHLAEQWSTSAETVPEVPSDVRSAFERRILTLPDELRQLLEVASVLGDEFDEEVLAALGQRTGLLHRGEELELVNRLEPGRWRFPHLALRESLYERLTEDKRSQLHSRVAAALEQLYGSEAVARSDDLAYHLFRAIDVVGADRAISAAREAARHATDSASHERAASFLAKALEVVERARPSANGVRLDLLLELGEAERLAGDADAARETYRLAAEAARSASNPEAFRRAAEGMTAWTHAYALRARPDRVGAEYLKEAIDLVGASASPQRAKLLAQLAFAQYFANETDHGMPGHRRSTRAAEEAIRVARAAGDPTALGAALHAQMYSVAGLDATSALAIADEMFTLGTELHDWELGLWARSWKVLHHLMLCDITAVDHEVRAFSEATEKVDVPVYRWFVARWRALRAMLSGRFVDGERLAVTAMEVGISAGHDEAAMLHLGGQLGLLRELQGRQRDLIVPIEEAVEEFPALVAWRCALTALYASHDRPEDARAHLDLLGRDRFAAVPVDWDWLVAMRSLAIASCLLEDGDRCAVLLDLLRPFDSMNACSGWATMCCGPIATHLGALASVLERWDEAEEYFELALRLGAALGAPPFIAQAHAAYADMLLRRGKRRRGLELAGRALAAADEMGMAEIAEQAHVLLTPRPRST